MPKNEQTKARGRTRTDFMVNLLLHGMVRGMLLLPYGWRIPLLGWIISRVLAPLTGYRKRIRRHLAYTCPDLPENRVKRICIATPNNFGRSLMELYSSNEFTKRMQGTPIKGEGAKALAQAHKDGRPVVLVTGHFGNYDAVRVVMIAKGYNIGALYMPMKNLYFNDHYAAHMRKMGGQLFARGRSGMAKMIKFLRGGGMTFFVTDRYDSDGATLRFFGKPAPTALSAANMALKYDALLVPVYGVRQKNGLDFEVLAKAPIPHSDAQTMTQAINDSMETMVRAHMEQWNWFHRRWGKGKIFAAPVNEP